MILIDLINELNKGDLKNLIFAEEPEKKLKEYVVISPLPSSGDINHLKAADFSVEAYSDSLLNAANFGEIVNSALKNLVEHKNITKIVINNAYPHIDTRTRRYLWECTINVFFYE